MPDRCVVGGCSQQPQYGSTWSTTINLHKFPKEKTRRSAWTHFVQLNRPDFTPSLHSVICSRHFLDVDFTNQMQFRVMTEGKAVDEIEKMKFV